MSRYQLLSEGVRDLTTGKDIKPDRSSKAWREYQEWLTAGNTPLPADSVGADDLATSKAKRKDEIDAYAAGLRNAVVRGRSAGEMASWAIKLAEARAYIASKDPAQAPTLAGIAQIRGITVADLSSRVLANSAPFLQAEAAIDGMRGKHCDAVDAMTDVRDIILYDWRQGWPVIP